jgi:putative membrane protein
MSEDRTELAGDRTDFAEDRTLLANERTFSGWARTSMASIGVGLGFHALFRSVEPLWVPKAIASLFFLIAILMVVLAERRAAKIKSRLDAHSIRTVATRHLLLITMAISGAALALIVALWLLV